MNKFILFSKNHLPRSSLHWSLFIFQLAIIFCLFQGFRSQSLGYWFNSLVLCNLPCVLLDTVHADNDCIYSKRRNHFFSWRHSKVDSSETSAYPKGKTIRVPVTIFTKNNFEIILRRVVALGLKCQVYKCVLMLENKILVTKNSNLMILSKIFFFLFSFPVVIYTKRVYFSIVIADYGRLIWFYWNRRRDWNRKESRKSW